MSDFDEAGQQWAGMNGAAAWALIDRHANNWNDTERMMNAWLDANRSTEQSAELARLRSDCVALAAWQCIYPDGLSGLTHDETGNATCRKDDELARLRDALRWAIREVERNACTHEETHRAGAIWTICDSCGRKWADDEGGFKPYVEPQGLIDARRALWE